MAANLKRAHEVIEAMHCVLKVLCQGAATCAKCGAPLVVLTPVVGVQMCVCGRHGCGEMYVCS